MGQSKNQNKISGKIKYVSVSPHGDPEGLVLNDGSFIKVPPHSLLNKDEIKVGREISGTAEMISDSPNRTYHHAMVVINGETVADDSVDAAKKEDLKRAHKKDLESRKDSPTQKQTYLGKAVAFGVKPKGEIDRIIFEDGTSVHVPKEVELDSSDFEVGDMLEVKGDARLYGKLRFLKAKSVELRR